MNIATPPEDGLRCQHSCSAALDCAAAHCCCNASRVTLLLLPHTSLPPCVPLPNSLQCSRVSAAEQSGMLLPNLLPALGTLHSLSFSHGGAAAAVAPPFPELPSLALPPSLRNASIISRHLLAVFFVKLGRRVDGSVWQPCTLERAMRAASQLRQHACGRAPRTSGFTDITTALNTTGATPTISGVCS